MSERVELKGYFLTVHGASEGRLYTTLDITKIPAQDRLKFIRGLEDLLSEIDEVYAGETERIRGRTIVGRFRRIAYGEDIRRIRTVKFTPLPSRIPNRVKKLRDYVYDKVNTLAIKIQSLGFAEVRRNIYLVPEENVEKLVKAVNKANQEIEKLNKMIESYLQSPLFKRIVDYLSLYDLYIPKGGYWIPKSTLNLIAVRLDASIVDEWARRSPEVAKMLEEAQANIIKSTVEEFRRRVRKVLEREWKSRLAVKKRLEELRELATGVGLRALAESVIVPLVELCDREDALVQLKKREIRDEVDEKIVSLLEQL